ncbi:MAG: aminodeoxychorismate synthase component I [Candidatus Theseobacter exili]|nr:aminodeoxychorismate synthase component I [Candidatus Theseobacter exili]
MKNILDAKTYQPDTVKEIFSYIDKEPDTVLLKDGPNWRLYHKPEIVICSNTSTELEECLGKVEKATKEGFYAAGFLSYEAGSYLMGLDEEPKTFTFPLIWFGIYPSFSSLPVRKDAFLLSGEGAINPSSSISKQEYIKAIEKIKDLIAAGDTYQVNYTYKLLFPFNHPPGIFFEHLLSIQDVPYAAYINSSDFTILSLSPELFFRVVPPNIEVKPMKGTASRGSVSEEDRKKAARLKRSPKNRAENIMITDLMRNDLGQICKPGSIHVPELCSVEKYSTLFQMISTVRGQLRKDVKLSKIFKSMFPSGSVTGAPKWHTMEIIHSLEKEPRKIYTGSIGYASPDGSSSFNVAIRTLLINRSEQKAELGIGGGIVWDSVAEKEYNESLLKAAFIEQPFQLLETILWTPEKGFFLFDLHCSRIKQSANFFSFSFDEKRYVKTVKSSIDKRRTTPLRIRILLSKSGDITIETHPLSNNQSQVKKVCFSRTRTSTDTIFLYHKTTRRNLYNKAWKNANDKGFFDVIFLNERKEITEGTVTNIMVKNGGEFFTPPVKCGLLNGVFRQHLLDDPDFQIEEKVIYFEDILKADEVFLINSVRGMVKVTVENKKI